METFDFDFDPRFERYLSLVGVRPNNSRVTIDDDHLCVEFGPWRLTTPMSNITGFQRSGDYKWYRAIGARGSFKDGGITFGTTCDQGVCTKFRCPEPALMPFGLMKHPGMTVTLADPDGFVAALERRIDFDENP